MNPGRYNISVYQGTTFTLAPVWKIDGLPVNLTGYTADMQVRVATDQPIIIELSTANGRAVINGGLGQIILTLTAGETSTLTEGTYLYDLNLTAPNSTVTKILTGNFTVQASVTQ